MRLREVLTHLFVCGGLLLIVSGCGGEDVTVAPVTGEVKATPPVDPATLKGDAKKAVGPGSSANIGKMNRNPMDATK